MENVNRTTTTTTIKKIQRKAQRKIRKNTVAKVRMTFIVHCKTVPSSIHFNFHFILKLYKFFTYFLNFDMSNNEFIIQIVMIVIIKRTRRRRRNKIKLEELCITTIMTPKTNNITIQKCVRMVRMLEGESAKVAKFIT